MRWGLQLAALLVILLGSLIGIARIALPLLENYRTEIESIAADVLQKPVLIGSIDTAWSGLNPVIVMRDAHIKDADSGNAAVELKELNISFDLIASLLNWKLRSEVVTMKIEGLVIHRQEDGQISLGLDTLTGNSDYHDVPENLQWVLEQPDTRIFAEAVEFKDGQAQLPDVCLQNADLSLQTQARFVALQFLAEACTLAERIELSARLPRSDLNKNLYSAEIYLEMKQASLAFWKEVLSEHASLPDQGTADIRLWADVRDSELAKIEGNISLSSLVYGDGAGMPFEIDSTQGNFNWQRTAKGWQLQVADWDMSRNNHQWPVSGLLMTFNEEKRQYDVRSRYLRVDDILPVVMIQPWVNENVDSKWRELRFEGSVADLSLQLIFDDDFSLEDYAAKARLKDFSMQAGENTPGIHGIDGYLVATSQAGLVDLQTENALLDMTTLFREPLGVNTLTGQLSWSVLNSGVLIESSDLKMANSHITTQSRLSIHLAEGQSPFVDIQTNFENSDGAYASLYWPAKIMPEAVIDWLDNGIVAGYIDGTFVLRGHMDDFPYDDREGRVEVRFSLKDGVLDYYNGWPRIEEIEAEVLFLGREMHIEATSGSIYDADIKRIVADIEDLTSNPILKVNGFAETSSRDLLKYLTETSLANDYQKMLSALELSGTHDFYLDMSIPLSGQGVEFNGTLDFNRNLLSIPDWQIELSDLKGRLSFSETTIEAEQLTASYLNHPVTSEVLAVNSDSGHETHIRLKTLADLSRLLAQKSPLLAEQIRGESVINVAIEAPDDPELLSRLIVSSDLKGTEICLPSPFIKSKDTELPFQLIISLGAEPISTLEASFQDRAHIKMKFNEENQLSSGMVYLGKTQTPLEPDSQKFEIRGHLDRLKLDSWIDWYSNLAEGYEGQYFDLPMLVDVDIGNMALSKWHLPEFNISGLFADDVWDMQFSGSAIAGKGVFKRHSIPLLKLELDAMSILEEPGAEINTTGNVWSFELLPSDIPSLDIDIKQLIYNNRDIGRAGLNSSSGKNTLRINEAYLRNAESESDLSIRGAWQHREDEHQTDIDIKIASADFGGLMRRLGYNDTVRGDIDSRGSFSAPLSPIEIGIEDINGEVEIAMYDGEVVEAEASNVGKIFGLLSFQALPRRLSLDFSDLFSQGMSFDEIEGDFTISEGNAYTNNLSLTAPSGTVEISGRVGLFDKDYDQLAKVTPNVSASLPVAGALAGGSGLAAILWITHQILGNPINKLTEIEYQISGTWAEPKIESLALANNPGSAVLEERPAPEAVDDVPPADSL